MKTSLTSIAYASDGNDINLSLRFSFRPLQPEETDSRYVTARTCLWAASVLSDALKDTIGMLLKAYAQHGFPDLYDYNEIKNVVTQCTKENYPYVFSVETATLSISRHYVYAAHDISATYFSFTADRFAFVVHHLLSAYVDAMNSFPSEIDLATYVSRKMRQNRDKNCSRDRSVNLSITYSKLCATSIFTRAWIENMNDADVRSLLKSMISRYCADGCPDDAYAWGYRVFRNEPIKSSTVTNHHPNAIYLGWKPDDAVAQAIVDGYLKKDAVVSIVDGYFRALTEVALRQNIPAKPPYNGNTRDTDQRLEWPIRRR